MESMLTTNQMLAIIDFNDPINFRYSFEMQYNLDQSFQW